MLFGIDECLVERLMWEAVEMEMLVEYENKGGDTFCYKARGVVGKAANGNIKPRGGTTER